MIFMAGGNAYSLYHENKSGWNPEAFRERFSEVLERFDYIVGDWGYNQLRLRGFYRDGHPRATKESTFSSVVDYINEYCNFGCAYFVLMKLDSQALPPDAIIMKEEPTTPEAIVALNETGEQVAETAAAASPPVAPLIINGQIMRWPIKERLGGPVRAPNVTVSAVARAAAEAERRNASSNVNTNTNTNVSQSTGSAVSSQTRGGQSKQGQDNGSNNRQSRPAKSYPPRQNRPQGQGNDQVLKANADKSPAELMNNRQDRIDPANGEASRNDNRWSSKNRRRKSFGGKPNQRPEGSPRSGE